MTTDQKIVDVQVSRVVLDAARARIAVVQEEERGCEGAHSTTLTDVARAAVLNWTAPDGEPPARRRLATWADIRDWANDRKMPVPPGPPSAELRRAYRAAHGLDTQAFRFTLPERTYDTRRDMIRQAGYSVARVVETALATFARTGSY